MGPISVRRLVVSSAIIGVTALASAVPASAAAKKVTVCKHGCHYTTIQSGVNATGKNAYVYVKPGKYVEGVTVSGHKHDGLHIIGRGKTPSAVLIEGKNAHGPEGLAQDGVEGDSVNNLDIENLKAENFASNGFFIQDCKGYTMKNLIGAFERSYGLYVFKCIGGRMTKSIGYGNGDSAFYIGGTPFQKKPVWSSVDHDIGYGNVLGYSGTNSKYVKITNGEFYDNGAGIVPNTLSSEPYEPADDGIIENNVVYWNNFDYYRAHSPVHTVSSGVHGANNYPIGAGIILFGTTGWTVKNNQVFGNWLWGVSAFSDPENTTKKAVNNDNTIENNSVGLGGRDLNGYDLYNDGSGKGTCFQNNGTVTEFPGSEPNSQLYPTCPTTLGGGAYNKPDLNAFIELANVATSDPPTKMENFWHEHPHAARANRTAYTGPPAKYPKGPGQ